MNELTESELTVVLEAARVALADAEVFDMIAYTLDIDDAELKIIQEKLEKITNKE